MPMLFLLQQLIFAEVRSAALVCATLFVCQHLDKIVDLRRHWFGVRALQEITVFGFSAVVEKVIVVVCHIGIGLRLEVAAASHCAPKNEARLDLVLVDGYGV